MNLLSVENISKSYGDKHLFRGVSFGISQGDRLALVARNGSGKSTLLNILQGREIPDTGEVAFRQDLRVGFLHQEPELNPRRSVYESLFDSSNALLDALGAYERALQAFDAEANSANQHALDQAMAKMDELQAWDLESRLKQILSRLNIHQLDQSISSLSGGEKRRVALAQLLINDPQLLIMDEPTNHLDIEMIEWLEAYFERNAISLLLVTHDRYFLDHVCQAILELEPTGIQRYNGDYEYFMLKKSEREEQRETERSKAYSLYKKELEWVRRQPKARGTKSKSRLEAFDQLKDKIKKTKQQEAGQFDFKMNRIGGKIMELKKITKSFGDRCIIDHFEHTFRKGERIGLVGKNGSGKSTFLSLISGEMAPDSGRVIHGDTIVVGYYRQDGLDFKPGQRVVEVVREVGDAIPMADGNKLTASQLLNLFGFSPAVQHDFVEKLSGGEKKRLYLLTILMLNPNFLILDEPTNDLDLLTLQVLEEFLQNFQGCLVLVSHDRYFMDKLVDQLFVFEGEGKISGHIGTYTEYRIQKQQEEKQQQQQEQQQPQENEEKNNARVSGEKKKLSFKEKFELEQLDEAIPALEERRKEILQAIEDQSDDHEALQRLGEELQKVQEDLDEKEMRWLELSE